MTDRIHRADDSELRWLNGGEYDMLADWFVLADGRKIYVRVYSHGEPVEKLIEELRRYFVENRFEMDLNWHAVRSITEPMAEYMENRLR